MFRLAPLQGKDDNLCSLQDDTSSTISTVTISLTRYCGKQSGFYPRDDDWAAAKIDEIIDTATDITVVFYFNDDHDDLVDDADDAFKVRSRPLILNNHQNNHFDNL